MRLSKKPIKQEVLIIRIDEATKTKLNDLSKRGDFNNNKSEVVRFLINSEHSRKR